MTNERLIELINHPENVEADEWQEIKDLVHEYPYFQAVRMLYLKMLYLKDQKGFQEALPSHTVHFSDHKQFLTYLHQNAEVISYVAPTEQEEDKEPLAENLPAVLYSLETALKGKAEERSEAESIPEDEQKQEKKSKKADLIDQFIQSEPGMHKINDAPADNRDLSKENPFGENELFSETLAKIYVKQELYDKAIATYVKLSLKYPEKSVYFANRIEKIKENITNKD